MRQRVPVGVAVLAGLLGLAALGGPLLVAVVGGRSSAAFGDREELGVNHLGAATLDLELGEQSSSITAPAMAPGDTAVGWLDLANRGDLPLRYSIVVDSSADPLLDVLRWEVWRGRTDCDLSTPRTPLVADVRLTPGVGVPLLGDPVLGDDPGDRTLAPEADERICLGATLPLDSGDALQGRTTTHTVHVVAEHDLDAQAALDGRVVLEGSVDLEGGVDLEGSVVLEGSVDLDEEAP